MQNILLIDRILFVATQQHTSHSKFRHHRHGLQSSSDLHASAKFDSWETRGVNVQQQLYHLQTVDPLKSAGTEQKAVQLGMLWCKHDTSGHICQLFLKKTVFMGMVTGQQQGSQQGKENRWIR